MKAYRSLGSSHITIEQHEPQLAAVTELWVPEDDRGHGIGQRLMRATCRDADREHVTLTLEPIPFAMWDPDDDRVHLPTMTHAELCGWYRHFGFRMKPRPAFNLMQRTPKEAAK